MPPSDDLRDSSALRQEGPQQDGLKQLLYAKLAKLQAWRDDHLEHERFRAACDIAVEDLKEIIHLQAALSASRTAQAPQQELARTTLICAAHMLDACAENMEKLCVGYGAEQMRGIAQRLREGTPTLEQACTAVDLKKAQARIQVLETSVDYLRYLVDHPVENTGGATHGSAPPETPMITAGTLENINDLLRAQDVQRPAAPPVAPAEGEK